MAIDTTSHTKRQLHPLALAGMVIGALIVIALLVWQGITSAGSPDPTAPHTSSFVAVLDIAALVFREGLECTLVLSAIVASLMGSNQPYRRPIGIGASVGFLATLLTWCIAVVIVNSLVDNFSALSVQAATGLLAIVVLLIVMNWFFHKVYWTGWISFQNRKKRDLLQEAKTPGTSKSRLLWGLGVLGFASFYREGFEVVLFLQSYRLQMGGWIVLYGAVIGLILSGIVAILTFIGHQHLPYKRMLIYTGILLVIVLFVMVGEEANEMQLAGWISTTNISWLQWIPDWAGLWFSIFPNVETVLMQLVALVVVLGSYFVSRYQATLLPKKKGMKPFQLRTSPPTKEEESLSSSSVTYSH
ncbi:MAG TPA: FTR1 family protein [Dictyobacter sp.]|jgi:high-affinity iron transporter|nr:FTR1 family protein [Dictyobacter sp.]